MTPKLQESVVILGGVPYETTANQTSLHMFDALARAGVPTLYVSRRVQHRSFRGRKRTSRAASGLLRVGSGSWILTLPRISDALPMTHPPAARIAQAMTIRWRLRRAMAQLGMEQPRLLAYWWMFPDLVADPIWRSRTFDLIDRHWGYEHLSMRRRELELKLVLDTASAADRTVAVSKGLADELTELGHPQVAVLANGVDLSRVQNALATGGMPRRPRSALYCGGWNSRIDEDVVRGTVVSNPDWMFEFIGGGIPAWLRAYDNVRDLGQLDYDSALRRMGSAQIGLVPFRKTQYTDASNFLKVLDYLATGMTVLATDLPALADAARRCPSSVVIDPSGEMWQELGRLPMAGQSPSSVVQYLTEQSTDRRVDILMARG